VVPIIINVKIIKKYRYLLTALFITVVTVYAVFWHLAKDEVYYLCSNFKVGVNQISVIRQLETANLSNYLKYKEEFGLKIIFSSKLHLSFYQCVIDIDKNKAVIRATFS
jgi:hypothetical protein